MVQVFCPSAVGRCSEAIGIFQVPREELSYQLDRSPKRRGRASINLQWNFRQTMCLFLHIRKTKYILTGCVCRELNFMFVDSWKSHIVMYLVKMLQRNVVHQEIHISCTVYIYIFVDGYIDVPNGANVWPRFPTTKALDMDRIQVPVKQWPFF